MSANSPQPLNTLVSSGFRLTIEAVLKKITFWRAVGTVLLGAGSIASFQRFYYGLGATTHLTDDFPWGFWIGFDFLGIGLAASGFTIAATVHLLNAERFKPIVRPAILTAFIGYLLVILVLIVDLGRPDHFWHPLVMWNPHSVMFEITWCVILYTTVLMLEFAPVVLEKFHRHASIRVLRAISLPVVIAGVILSTLHQSSFGSLYLIVPGRLHPLWYSPLLPVLFFVSCIAAGLSMIIFQSLLLSRRPRYAIGIDLLAHLGKVVAVVLTLYATVRVQDLAARGSLPLAFSLDYQSILFGGELLLGVLLPATLLLWRRIRESQEGLFFSSILVLMGFTANRMNTVVTGMESWPDRVYFPSWQELAIGLGVATVGFLLFRLVATHFNVLPEATLVSQACSAAANSSQTDYGQLGRTLTCWLAAFFFLGVVVLGYARVLLQREGVGIQTSSSRTPDLRKALTHFQVPPDVLLSKGQESPGQVTFNHGSHVDSTQPECLNCHRQKFHLLGNKSFKASSEPSVNPHQGKSCASCHNGDTAFSVDEECSLCHKENQ